MAATEGPPWRIGRGRRASRGRRRRSPARSAAPISVADHLDDAHLRVESLELPEGPGRWKTKMAHRLFVAGWAARSWSAGGVLRRRLVLTLLAIAVLSALRFWVWSL